jgi:iron complex transport system ATP-binding protein
LFHVILGPNGAGKSTVLKLAAGLISPSAGEVRCDGRALDQFNAETLARRRAVLSQLIDADIPLTVEQVVQMGRYPHEGRPSASRNREIALNALERVKLIDRRSQSYQTLSGGERQIVQLARILAQIWEDDEGLGSRILFLDEPTAHLDIAHQIRILDLVQSLTHQNLIVIAVLHDLNAALHYGDRFLFLNRGRLAYDIAGRVNVSKDLLENVYDVAAHLISDASTNRAWQFTGRTDGYNIN